MKLLKKYLFIIGTITIFLITPLSIQLQTNTNFLHKNTELDQNKTNKSFVSIEIPIANAESVYSVDPDGLLNCNSGKFPSISCGLVNFTYMITVQAGNYLVGMSATLMDFFLAHSLKSSSYNGSPFIKGGWEILRDITNIVFIFALLFIAFQMVLGGGKGKAKGYLIKIILITLTINFSLFFTYAIIDSSNIFAHVFYNKINQEDVTFQTKIDNNTVSKKSASLAIANKINPQRLFLNQKLYSKGEHILMSVMSGVINGVMIYVFLSVSFLFLGRTLGLWLAAILSPLAFASLTVPKMDNIDYVGFKKWLPSLLKMAFMAPVFIFILYLTIQFMNIYSIGTASGMTIDNLLNIIIPLAMITAMLLLAKKIANSMSGDFAGIISSFVGKFVGGAVGVGAMVATGGAAALGGAAGLAKSGVGQLSRIGNRGKLTEKGKKRVEGGRRWRSTKVFDVTKIPGFNKMSSKSGLGGASKFFSKNLAGTSMRGTENKIKLGALEMREKSQDFIKGKDFKESEAKFERKKTEYTKEKEKREGGAATWQEKLRDTESAKQIGIEKRTILQDFSKENPTKTNKKFIEDLKETLSKGVVINSPGGGIPERVEYKDRNGVRTSHSLTKRDPTTGTTINISRSEYEDIKKKEFEKRSKREETNLKNARATGNPHDIRTATTTLNNLEKDLAAFKKGSLESIEAQVIKKEKTIESQSRERAAIKIEGEDAEAAKRIRTGKVKIEEAVGK